MTVLSFTVTRHFPRRWITAVFLLRSWRWTASCPAAIRESAFLWSSSGRKSDSGHPQRDSFPAWEAVVFFLFIFRAAEMLFFLFRMDAVYRNPDLVSDSPAERWIYGRLIKSSECDFAKNPFLILNSFRSVEQFDPVAVEVQVEPDMRTEGNRSRWNFCSVPGGENQKITV